MKKKQIEFKRKINFHFLSIISSVLFSAIIVAFFAVIGYSVAKPFGSIGEIKPEPLIVDDIYTSKPDDNTVIPPDAVRAYWLVESEINDLETLERMLERIGESYNTVIVPMKLAGGKLNYSSQNDGAVMAGASSEISIEEIINAVKSKGYKPAASVNTLNDNLYPKADKSSGFVNKSDGSLWFDAAESKGGKAWLSPAASSAGAYLSALTSEIASAGFEYIIATDAQFPEFSRIGLDAIGETVTNENRYLDLIDIVNNVASAASSNGSVPWIEISAAEMFDGTCEVFQPLLLDTDKTVLEINLDDFNGIMTCGDENVDFSKMNTAQKVEKVCDIAETFIYKTSFIPEITGKRISSADQNEAAQTLEKMNYSSYIIR